MQICMCQILKEDSWDVDRFTSQLFKTCLPYSVYIYQFLDVSDNYFSELIILFISTNILSISS